MNVEHYHEFVVLAEELNFHTAAKRLCMTQSTLSKHIAALEAHYQARLLERDKSHVSLTSDGSLLLESAIEIWSAYERSVDLLKNNRANGATLFIGGILDSPSEYPIVSAVVEQFKAIDGRYSTHFAPCISASLETQVELLQRGEVDIVIVNATAVSMEKLDNASQIIRKTVCKVPLDAIVSKHNQIAEKDALRVTDLAGQTLMQLIGPRVTPSWKLIEQQLLDHKITFATRPIPVSSTYDYLNLNPDNAVLLATRASVFSPLMQHPETIRVPIGSQDLYLNLSALYLPENKTQAIEDFLTALKNCYAKAFPE